MDCQNHTVSVEWAESVGALSYTATLERTSGELTCCHSNTSTCRFSELPCGEMYVLTVTAEGRTCNSSQSEPTIVRTGKPAHTHTHMHILYIKILLQAYSTCTQPEVETV